MPTWFCELKLKNYQVQKKEYYSVHKHNNIPEENLGEIEKLNTTNIACE